MQTTDNVGLKLYEGTDLFNPLVVENPNCETLDEVIKAISDQAIGSATELVTGTVHALTRGLDDTDRDVFIFTATSNFTAGDTFTLDGQQVSALTVAGTQLSNNCYIIGSSVLVHKRDTLLTFYVSETTAKDAEKLGGELPSYYATKTGLDAVVADISALATKVGTAVLTTQAPDLSGAVNELNTHLSAHTFGESVNIVGYNTPQNMFTLPSDGYIFLSRSYQNVGEVVCHVMQSGAQKLVFNAVSTAQASAQSATFLKAGMEVYITATAGASVATFEPLS